MKMISLGVTSGALSSLYCFRKFDILPSSGDIHVLFPVIRDYISIRYNTYNNVVLYIYIYIYIYIYSIACDIRL